MITHIFRKNQDSSPQFCSCSLTANGIAKSQKGEKFLTRPQTQSSTGNIQVNRSKVTGFKKEKQIKLSLRGKQKKHDSTQISTPVTEIGSKPKFKMELQTNLAFKIGQPVVRSPYQQTQFVQKNMKQRPAYILAKQMYPRQGIQQIKIDNNIQRYEKPFTQQSTQLSNLTQAKNSIQLGSAKISSKFLYNNTSISIIQQKGVIDANCLPRSKSFSINKMRMNSNFQNNSFIIEENQNQASVHHLGKEANSCESADIQLKLSGLRFKSAESIQQIQNDQHSELASENSQLSHTDINDDSWSHSLNQIFVKKLRRLNYNPPA